MRKPGSIFFFLLVLLAGCNRSENDKDIRQLLAVHAKKEAAFAGVSFVVKDGVVTLTGHCPSETDKSMVEETVKSTTGVTQVINQIAVSPAVLTGDQPLQQSVDRILKKYPTVTGTVKDSVIVVQGNIDIKNAQKLIKALQSLKAKGLTNELVMSSEVK